MIFIFTLFLDQKDIPIIKAAGGTISTWKKEDPVKAGNIIVSANKNLHKKVLNILKSIS